MFFIENWLEEEKLGPNLLHTFPYKDEAAVYQHYIAFSCVVINGPARVCFHCLCLTNLKVNPSVYISINASIPLKQEFGLKRFSM